MKVRNWKERICALLLAVTMVVTWMLPDMSLTVQAAWPWDDTVDATFSIVDSEDSNALLRDDVTIKVMKEEQEVEVRVKPEEDGTYTVSGLHADEKYTYTVEKSGYEYTDPAAERTFTPTENSENNTVEVSMKMSEIELSKENVNLVVGKSEQIYVNNAVSELDYTWSITEGSEFVSVQNNGTITADGAGGSDEDKYATVEVTNGRKTASVSVTISKNDFPLELNVENISDDNGKLKCVILGVNREDIPKDAEGDLSFYIKGEDTDYTFIGRTNVHNYSVVYDNIDQLLGKKIFRVEYSGDTKYKSSSDEETENIYYKEQPIEIDGETSKTVTYGDVEGTEKWNDDIIISLKDAEETIKGRKISVKAEFVDSAEEPNTGIPENVAEISVQDDNTIKVTPKNAGKIKITITAEENGTYYNDASTEFILTVNRKSVNIGDITWNTSQKVYDGGKSISLSGIVTGSSEKILITDDKAEVATADAVADSEGYTLQDVTIAKGIYYAEAESEEITANYKLDLQDNADNIVKDKAIITRRPVYVTSKNASVELEYGQDISTAVKNMDGLVELCGQKGERPGDKSDKTGVVGRDTITSLPSAALDIPETRILVKGYENSICPDITDENKIVAADNSEIPNYELNTPDNYDYKGDLRVIRQSNLSTEQILSNITLTDRNGVYGITSGEQLSKIWASIAGTDEFGTKKENPVLQLAVKDSDKFEATDYYDLVYISFDKGKTFKEATTDGISLDGLKEVTGQTESQVIDNIRIRLASSLDPDNTYTKEVKADDWLYVDNKAPEAHIINYEPTLYSEAMSTITFGLFQNKYYTADVKVTDGGSGLSDKQPQQYYVYEMGSNISDNNLTQDAVTDIINEINNGTVRKWKTLEFKDGVASFPVGKGQNEETIDNNYLIFIRTIDNTGNCAVYVSNGMVIEQELPSINCTFSSDGKIFDNGKVLGYNDSAKYTLTIDDPEAYFSGISKIETIVTENNTTVEGSGNFTEITEDTVYEDSYTYEPDKKEFYSYQELKEDSGLTINGIVNIDNVKSNNVVLTVKAYDRAGNESVVYTKNLILDRTAPEISVEFDKNDPMNGKYYQDSRTMIITYTERNFGFNSTADKTLANVDKDNVWFELKTEKDSDFSNYSLAELNALEGIEVKFVEDSQKDVKDETNYSEGRSVTYEIAFTGQNEYTIIPHCKDKLTNETVGNEYNFVVDTEAPQITDITYSYFDETADKFVPYDSSEAKNATVKVSMTIKEHYFKINNDSINFENGQINLSIQAADTAEGDSTDYQTKYQTYVNKKENWGTVVNQTDTDEWKVVLTFDNDANYSFNLRYSDLSGKSAETGEQTFTVDKTQPNGTMSIDDRSFWDNVWRVITFNIFKNTSYDVKLTSDDATSGVVSTAYYKAKNPISEDEVENLTDSRWTEGTEFSVSPNEQFTVYGRIIDRAGNVRFIYPTNGAVADNTQPEISITEVNRNASSNGIYNEDIVLHVDVQDPTNGDTYSGLERVWYDVSASGNVSASETITLMDNSDNRVQSHQNWSGNITIPASRYNSNDIRVQVHALDFSGNQYDSEVVPLSIDITEPTIQVTYDLNSPLNDRYYNATRTATVVVTERNFDESAVRFDITNTDGTQPSISGWSHSSDSGVSDSATHTCRVTFSADGDYTFTLNTTDLAGNDSNYTRVDEFTIDQTDPTIQVSYDNNNDAVAGYYNAERTATITINEHNFNASEVNAQITARLQNRGVSAPGIGGWSTRGDVHTASVTFSADADYTFDVDYTDLAGNAAADYDQDSFTIDQTDPEIEFFDIEDKSANKDTVAPGVSYSDINYDENGVKITIEGAEPDHSEEAVDGRHTDIPNGESIKMADFEHTEDNDDVYTMTAEITDRAGNTTEESIVFSVNRFGSTYVFSDETREYLAPEEGDEYIYTNEPQDIEVTERNVDTLVNNGIFYGRDGELVNLEEGTDYTVRESGSDVSWKEYRYDISKDNFEQEGHYTVTIDSEDRAENLMNNQTKGLDIEFVVDKTAPSVVITGIEEDAYTADTRDMMINVTDNTAAKQVEVLIEGQVVETFDQEMIQESGGKLTYTINSSSSPQLVEAVAVDKAGNEAVSEAHTVLVSANLFVQYINNTPLLIGSIILLLVIAGAVCYIVIIRKRREQQK